MKTSAKRPIFIEGKEPDGRLQPQRFLAGPGFAEAAESKNPHAFQRLARSLELNSG